MTSSPPYLAPHLLRARLGKVCVAVTAESPEALAAKAGELLREFSFLELRLDYLPEPAAALPLLRELIAANVGSSFLATCRRMPNGGHFKGSAAAELKVLLDAAEAGFQVVDLSIESAEELPKDTVSRLRSAGAAVLLSFHDFKATGDLEKLERRMLPFAPDVLKIVTTASTLADNLKLLKYLQEASDRATPLVVGMAMGEAGVLSRVLSLRAGAAFTFAAATAEEATAPGQIAARTLLETYRIESVDNSTRVYGVAGDPIGSSLSPLIHNTAFRRETVNAVYVALKTNDAKDLFELARAIPLGGLSITMPLKQAVIPFLERTDPLSAKIGAVNTISRMPDGKFYGFNTDVAGILTPLERRLPLREAKVLVLGAGGAARAAVFACASRGAKVSILNRTAETAAKLAKEAGAKVVTRDKVAAAGFDVVINATPAGMNGQKIALPLGADDLNCKLVFDLVYNPIETPLLQMARAKGIAVISGVEMFVQQGARQFEIWTGKPAPAEEMLKVVLHALRQGGESPENTVSGTAAPPPEPPSQVPTAEAPRVSVSPSRPTATAKTALAKKKAVRTK